MGVVIFCLFWILIGVLDTYLIWRFDKDWQDITGWNLLLIHIFSPILLIYGLAMAINSIHIPNKVKIDKLEADKEPKWVKDARAETEQLLKGGG